MHRHDVSLRQQGVTPISPEAGVEMLERLLRQDLAATAVVVTGRFGELQIWDIQKQEMKLSLMIGYDTIYGASWSPNGKMVAVGCPA